MENELLIHRGFDEMGQPLRPISEQEWSNVIRLFPQLTQTRTLTHRQTGEVIRVWSAEIDDYTVEFQINGGAVNIDYAYDPEEIFDLDERPNPEEPLLKGLAAALDATVELIEEEEVTCATIRLEFETKQDWRHLDGLVDLLDEKLKTAKAGTIVGEGLEDTTPKNALEHTAALDNLIQQQPVGAGFVLQTLLLYLETPDVEKSAEVLKSAIRESDRIPSGAKILIVNDHVAPEFRYGV